MLTQEEAVARRDHAAGLFHKAGIYITDAEKAQIETADFGLNQFEQTGLGVLVYVNTERCCAKELAMWPHQTCPEHRHPPVGSDPGKEETFRCRWGTVYLYVSGQNSPEPQPAVTPPLTSLSTAAWKRFPAGTSRKSANHSLGRLDWAPPG